MLPEEAVDEGKVSRLAAWSYHTQSYYVPHFNKREYRRISAPNSCAMACSTVQCNAESLSTFLLHLQGFCKLLYQNIVLACCFGTLHPFSGILEFFSSFRRLGGGSQISSCDASRAFFSILPFQLADRISSHFSHQCVLIKNK